MAIAATHIELRSFFLSLDLFSRFYLFGILATTILGAMMFVRLEVGRLHGRAGLNPQIVRMARNLDSLLAFCSILARALIATQIVGLFQVLLIMRFTDADPVSAINEAWLSTQITVLVLLTLAAMRWRASSVFGPDGNPA
jgi:hypothetical protein